MKKNNIQTWASPSVPKSLDNNFDSSLGTLDAISSCYDGLLEYEYIPDLNNNSILRENISYNPNEIGGFKLKGKLAESWQLHRSMKTVTFKLKEGVISHWGNELTSKDIKWSWERKLAIGGIGGFFASIIGLNKPEQIKIENKYTVTFDLDKPASLILKVHRNPRNYIYDSKKIKESSSSDDPWGRKWIADNIAGFGPYKMISLNREKKFEARIHDKYWGKKPSIEKLLMIEVNSSSKRVDLLKKQEVDIAQFLTPLQISSLKNENDISIDQVNSSNMVWINLNCKQQPFDSKSVRQAMNIAFPKFKALETVYQNYGRILEGVLPDFYPGFVGESCYTKTNLKKAKELLKDSGYSSGFSTYCIYDEGQEFMKPLLNLYKVSLELIGVNLSLKPISSESYFNELQSNKHPLKITRYAPWCADPGYALTVSFLSSSLGNYSNYENTEVDKLINDASFESDSDARFAMLDEAQRIILEESPWVQICNPDFNLARNSKLRGWVYRTFNHTKAQDFFWN